MTIAALVVGAVTGSSALLWVLGPLIGIALGSLSAVDRVFLLRLIPPERRGEDFALYALVGKLSSGFGPLVLWGGTVLVATELGLSKFDASRLAIIVLAGAALAGYLILRPLPEAPAAGPGEAARRRAPRVRGQVRHRRERPQRAVAGGGAHRAALADGARSARSRRPAGRSRRGAASSPRRPPPRPADRGRRRARRPGRRPARAAPACGRGWPRRRRRPPAAESRPPPAAARRTRRAATARCSARRRRCRRSGPETRSATPPPSAPGRDRPRRRPTTSGSSIRATIASASSPARCQRRAQRRRVLERPVVVNCANCSARKAAISRSGASRRVATIARQAGAVALRPPSA